MMDPISESLPPSSKPVDYETLLESASEGICAIDRQGRFAFVNRAAAEMLGYTIPELLGRPCHSIWHHSKADRSPYPEASCPLYDGYARGIRSEGEEECLWRKDNTPFPVLYSSNPTYEEGILTGTVVVFRDITRRKQNEADLARHTADLAAQNAVAATLSRSLDLEANLEAALDVVLPVTAMDAGLIYVLEQDGEELRLLSSRDRPARGRWLLVEREEKAYRAISAQAVTNVEAVICAGCDLPDADDCTTDSAGERPQGPQRPQMLISVPLISQDRPVGALTLGSRRAESPLPSTLALITAFGQQIGMAVENAHLYRAAERAAEMLSLLHQVSIFLTSTIDATEIYDRIAAQSVRLLDCQIACILSWDDRAQRAELVASYGIGESEVHILREEPTTSTCLQNLVTCRQSTAVSDATIDPRIPLSWKEVLGIQALLCVAIQGVDQPMGTLILMDRRAPRRWRPEECQLIESFVNRAALALVNAQMHKQLAWSAALEERQRIAAEMHDGLAQTIGLLGLLVNEAIELTARGDNGQTLKRLSHVRDVVDGAYTDVRQSIASLHRPLQPLQALQEILPDLVAQLPVQGGPKIQFIFDAEEPLFLSLAQRTEALLIVQEALLNAHRHAHAGRISIRLESDASGVHITIADDGCGFDPRAQRQNKADHFGLGIMQARAARVGARLQLDSAPGQGTRITLSLPPDSGGYHAQGTRT